MRLEPSPREADIDEGLAARIHDPAWMLARQWQFGEFRGDDAGSPASVAIRGQSHPITHRRASDGSWVAVDLLAAPLEQVLEAERPGPDPRLALRAAVRLRRNLVAAGQAMVADAIAAELPAPTTPGAVPTTSELHQAVRSAAAADPVGANDAISGILAGPDPGAAVAARWGATDPASALAALTDWMAWWQPRAAVAGATEPAWDLHHLEHRALFAAGSLPGVGLLVDGYPGGSLDWYHFDLVPTDEAPAADPVTVTATSRPAPAAFGGMPANRYWEFEDGRFNLGDIDASTVDLGRLMLTQFATVYGNDWFVAPLRLPAGALFEVDAVEVQDAFGRSQTLRRCGIDSPDWDLFRLTDDVATVRSDRHGFFLCPSLVAGLQGPDVERVVLGRDEMANLAWAIEELVEDDAGIATDRIARSRAERAAAGGPGPVMPVTPPAEDDPDPRYRIDTDVPRHWFPLAAEQLADGRSFRLRLAPLARLAGGELVLETPAGRLLVADPAGAEPVWLHEEEVPREGVVVTRAAQRVRWHDGTSRHWTGRRAATGLGEQSPGLRFDWLERGPG